MKTIAQSELFNPFNPDVPKEQNLYPALTGYCHAATAGPVAPGARTGLNVLDDDSVIRVPATEAT
jgi:hypothetical protein